MRFDLLSRNSVFARGRTTATAARSARPRRGFWRNLIDWFTEY